MLENCLKKNWNGNFERADLSRPYQMTNSSNSKAQELWAHMEEGPQHTNELVFCSRCLQSELITPQTRRAWKWSVTILRPGALFQLGLIHGLQSAFFIEQYNQCGCSCAAKPVQEIQESPSEIFPFALDWLHSLFVRRGIKKEPAAKFGFFPGQGHLFHSRCNSAKTNIIFESFIIPAKGWSRVLVWDVPGWMGALAGQGNPIPRKKARQWCLPGGRGWCGTHREWGVFPSAPEPARTPPMEWAPLGICGGTEWPKPHPAPNPCASLVLHYFISLILYLYTQYMTYIIDISA